MKEKIKLLELFAGSRSVGKEAEKQGMEVFSVDWTAYDGIHLQKDIGEIEPDDIPWMPDAIWASPDCTTYSIAACSTHRNKDRSGKTEYAKKCDQVNKRVLTLIEWFMSYNPDLVYFIENPRGILRHMDFMQDILDVKRHTVWYCKYGDDRAKPTDIWTNSKTWVPRPMCKNYKYDKDGNIIDRHCHHESARRGAKTGTQGRDGSYDRSKIPQQLCEEILKSV